MSETPTEIRKPAGQTNWLWIILAVLAMGGFFVWLAANSTTSSVAVVEEAPEGDGAAAAGAGATIALADLATGAAAYVGQTVRLDTIAVTSLMGPQSFWTALPNGTPYLVKLDTALIRAGIMVQPGDRVTVSGRVVEMTDSVIAAWEQQGAIVEEGHRAQAQFATTFIEAIEAVPAPATGGMETSDGGAAE